MGHTYLGKLPKTQLWNEVVGLLENEADTDLIAQKSFSAIDRGLSKISADAGFTHVLTDILQFADRAASGDSASFFAQSGMSASEISSPLQVVALLREAADKTLRQARCKSDLSELAQNSFSEAFLSHVRNQLPTLFTATKDDLKGALKRVSSGKPFQALMHDFYSVFTRRYVSYYLSRELSNHVGTGKKFRDLQEHTDFYKALDHHIRQTVRISDDFTPGWFGKARFEKRVTHEDVTRYAFIAFKKIRSEFKVGVKSDEH